MKKGQLVTDLIGSTLSNKDEADLPPINPEKAKLEWYNLKWVPITIRAAWVEDGHIKVLAVDNEGNASELWASNYKISLPGGK